MQLFFKIYDQIKTPLKKSFWVLSSNIISSICFLIAIPLYLRVASNELVAEYITYFNAIPLMALFDFGLSQASIYLMGRSGFCLKEYIRATTPIFLMSLSIYIIFGLVYLYYNNSYVFLLFAPYLVLYFVFIIVRAHYDSHEDFIRPSIASTMNAFIILFLPILLFQLETLGIIISFYLGIFLQLYILMFFRGCRWHEKINFGFDIIEAKSLFGISKSFYLISLSIPVLTRFDKIYLYDMVDKISFLQYSIGQELIAKILIIPVSLMRVGYPALVQNRNVISQYTVTLASIATLWVFLFLIAYEKIFDAWLPNKFEVNGSLVYIFLIGIFFNILAQGPSTYLLAIGKAGVLARVQIFEMFMYVPIFFYYVVDCYSAAVIWSSRLLIDYMILYIIKTRN